MLMNIVQLDNPLNKPPKRADLILEKEREARKIAARITKLEIRQNKNGRSEGRTNLILQLKAKLDVIGKEMNLICPGDLILNLDPNNKNLAESAFTRRATSLGWAVIKRGFPDYICWKGKQVIFVEVKPEGDELSVYQQIVMQLLLGIGLQCFKWSPIRGLQKLKHNETALAHLIMRLQVDDRQGGRAEGASASRISNGIPGDSARDPITI